MQNDTLSTAEVATIVGVHRDTLLRWLREKMIPEPERDHRGWRIFTRGEAEAISRFAQTGQLESSALRTMHDPRIVKLRGIDWDFSAAKTQYLTHGMHPYPAKFIPQIPNALIQELSSVGETVADIFCGSGTTLLEALQLKRNALGIDANPLACLISKAKTTPLTMNEVEEIKEHIRICNIILESIRKETGDLFFSGRIFQSNGWRPSEDITNFWFAPLVVEELAEILHQIGCLDSENVKDYCKTIFSSIVVTVSKQDSDTRYVRRQKSIKVGDTLERYITQLKSTMESVIEMSDIIEPRFKCRIINSNILYLPETDRFDLVISSPPYPNAYSYHLYHRLRLIWLGHSEREFKEIEIGSHRKYSSKGKNRASPETFAEEFSQILSWLKIKLKPRRYACFVIGESTIDNRRIDNAGLISERACSLGFIHMDQIERRIASKRKSFNPKIGKIRTEQILILRNGA